jgi:L-2-hydroxyglutarate oxidase LhgO
VAHQRCGKLIVATSDADLPALHKLQATAQANGVTDLRWLSEAEAQAEATVRADPFGSAQGAAQVRWLSGAEANAQAHALRCVAALLSPSTGIIDSHGLMLALLGDAEAAGAMLALCAPVQAGRITPQGIELDVGGDEPMQLRARAVVNSAGLHAPALARRLAGLDAAHIPRDHLAKGCYFSLPGRAPFSRLVYPAPGQSSHLGVHLTLDLGGQARFGPSFEWVDTLDYTVDAAGADHFYAEVRRYWPALPDGVLQPAYAGIRPKITGPGEPAADFRIDGPAVHGVPGLVNLFGIESPGLTSSLAIAELVLARLGHSDF